MTEALELRRKPKPREMFEENREAFNKAVRAGQAPDLRGHNLSDLDLRGFDLKNQDLSNTYLRGANLSGLDLSGANLAGASIKNARISGCYFPLDLSSAEILMSLNYGTRLRSRKT